MLRTILFTISIFVSLLAGADNDRFEILLDGNKAILSTTVLNNVVVVTFVDDFGGSQHIPDRVYAILDTNLNLIEEHRPQIDFRNKFVGAYESEGQLSHFFYDYRYGNYTVVSIDSTGQLSRFEGKLPPRIYEPDFAVGGEMMYVVNNDPRKHQLVWTELGSESFEQMQIPAKVKRSVRTALNLQFHPQANRVSYAWAEEGRRKSELHYTVWGSEGEWLGTTKLDMNSSSVKSVTVSILNDDEVFLSGTYGAVGSRVSTGVYFVHSQDGSPIVLKQTPFSSFQHFFDYMSQQEKDDFERRMKRLERHEKSTNVGSLVNTGVLTYVDSSFVLPLEIYTENYTDTYGITRNRNSVAGMPRRVTSYHFSHASLVRFNTLGDFLHDDYVNLNLGYDPVDKDPVLRLGPIADTLRLAYAARHNIYIGGLMPRSFVKLEKSQSLIPKSDGVIEQDNHIIFWCGGNCVALYGFQTFKRESFLRENKNIYFIEKRKLR